MRAMRQSAPTAAAIAVRDGLKCLMRCVTGSDRAPSSGCDQHWRGRKPKGDAGMCVRPGEEVGQVKKGQGRRRSDPVPREREGAREPGRW
jgi:hypothetical protein